MHYCKTRLIAGLTIALVLLLITGMMATAQAAEGLPDRNPPAPQDAGGDDSGPIGTYIELVAPAHAGAWSVVQWQDSAGNWHDVEGWRGTLDNRGVRRWWVAAKDFGTGPFRWVVEGAGAVPAAGLWATDEASVAAEWNTGDDSGSLFSQPEETDSSLFNLPGGAAEPLMVVLP